MTRHFYKLELVDIQTVIQLSRSRKISILKFILIFINLTGAYSLDWFVDEIMNLLIYISLYMDS